MLTLLVPCASQSSQRSAAPFGSPVRSFRLLKDEEVGSTASIHHAVHRMGNHGPGV